MTNSQSDFTPLSLILARKVANQNGLTYVEGWFDGIAIDSFPSICPEMYAYQKFLSDTDREGSKAVLQLSYADGDQEFLMSFTEIVKKIGKKFVSYEISFQIPPEIVHIPRAGVISFQLLVDNEPVSQAFLRVLQRK